MHFLKTIIKVSNVFIIIHLQSDLFNAVSLRMWACLTQVRRHLSVIYFYIPLERPKPGGWYNFHSEQDFQHTCYPIAVTHSTEMCRIQRQGFHLSTVVTVQPWVDSLRSLFFICYFISPPSYFIAGSAYTVYKGTLSKTNVLLYYNNLEML